MARYELDEIEADEVYHSLAGRKMALDGRAKSLEEREGLPEAAQAVRDRIAIYLPNGEGTAARPGLLKLFAPQRDLDAERQNAQADEERDANGDQDLFGGGAETGGGVPAGQTEPAKPKRGRKKKGESADAPEPPAATPEVRDPIDVALDQLAALGESLVRGDDHLTDDAYDTAAASVIAHLPIANPGIDREILTGAVTETRAQADNAHALGYFVQRNVDAIRDARERPIRRDDDDDTPTGEQTLKDVNQTSDVPPLASGDPPS